VYVCMYVVRFSYKIDYVKDLAKAGQTILELRARMYKPQNKSQDTKAVF
jgi:hypothetical protein